MKYILFLFILITNNCLGQSNKKKDSLIYGFWCDPGMQGEFHFHNQGMTTVYIDTIVLTMHSGKGPHCVDVETVILKYDLYNRNKKPTVICRTK